MISRFLLSFPSIEYIGRQPQRYDTSLNVKKTRVSSVVKSGVSNLSQFINDVFLSKVKTN